MKKDIVVYTRFWNNEYSPEKPPNAIELLINGKEYGFNIAWVPAQEVEWLGQILQSQFKQCYEQGFEDAKKETRKAHEHFLETLH